MTGMDKTLQVPGANLYYRVRGSGPILLILQCGDGDADASDAMADLLADDYTVVAYDRRGLSRSEIASHDGVLGIETHSDDACRLVAALTPQPAFVLGCSIGALVGLDLVAHHPERVHTLIAHEPPDTHLLSGSARAEADKLHAAVAEAHRTTGPAAAMRKFVTGLGIDLNDREPDVTPPRLSAQRMSNTEFFLTHDFPAVRRYHVDVPALRRAPTRIVPAGGRSSRGCFTYRCSAALAEGLGARVTEFPGGHNGVISHPTAFAATLRGVLQGSGSVSSVR